MKDFLVDQLDRKPREKKQAQAELIQNLWQMTFEKELKHEDATWLVGQFGTAYATWLEIEKLNAKGIRHPLAYLKTMIRKQKELAEQPDEVFDLEGYLSEMDQAASYVKELGLYLNEDDSSSDTETQKRDERAVSGYILSTSLWDN